MTLREFIETHKTRISAIINRELGNADSDWLSTYEFELWIHSDEALYKWAKDEGVKL